MQSHSPCADMIVEVTLTENTQKTKTGGRLKLPLHKLPQPHKSELHGLGGALVWRNQNND
ncbi:MAG: hypothetical protein Alis3KO_41380 [Aliiglaciecola sp.]